MEIINNKLNSLPQQVEENMENIKLLASYLKEAYKSSDDLTSSSTTCLLVNTNVPDDVTDGWLLSNNGLLFKIVGNNGISAVLINYYATLRGEQGIQGNDGAQGDRGYSMRYNNSVYVDSSTDYTFSDTLPILDLQQDDLILFSDGTLAIISSVDSDNSTYRAISVTNIYSNITIPQSYIIQVTPAFYDGFYHLPYSQFTYADGYPVGSIDEVGTGSIVYNKDLTNLLYGVYQVVGYDTNDILMVKITDVSRGKQLYQHNIHLRRTDSSDAVEIYLNIISDSDTQFTIQTLSQWLYSKGFYYQNQAHNRNSYVVSGYVISSGTTYYVNGIQDTGANNGSIYAVGGINTTLTLNAITDTIIAL